MPPIIIAIIVIGCITFAAILIYLHRTKNEKKGK
jgi:hypothetical protein